MTLISSGEKHSTFISTSATSSFTTVLGRYRKYLHGTLSSTATRMFWPLQEREAHVLLSRLMKTPDHFLSHIRRAVTATIVQVAYGHQIVSDDDPYVSLAQDAQEKFSLAATPNTFAVDWFPIRRYYILSSLFLLHGFIIVRYLPDWVPGAGFKVIARQWRAELMYLLRMPITNVKEQIRVNTAQPSYAATLLSRESCTEEMENEVAWSALSLYTGGADTVSEL